MVIDMEENKATNLKNVSTNDLIKELESREGIEKTTTGLYQPYRLTRKYCKDRNEISADLLIINLQLREKESLANSQAEQDLFRRFTPNKDTHELETLCREKNITRDDLLLICGTLSLNDFE
ncbi:hypothetical protein Bccel_0072 [Pseudobacteroides cellulosolvens ATCC 35603 = DSM 2933]|uniref:Uncharacterized protein n=2 Tax=Pseudobacteroides cellulosolvens TaxID=35825 RepID=A0A0L6JGJ6_9FIRM|nr:hypothetical protein Bccel_0072 [Pseudobacteroides cellulosolvens ATCC 35603 = DSM 2933]